MTDKKTKSLTLPKLDWKHATCPVCGKSFDYHTARRPATCKNGDCLHAWHYKTNPDKWATHQPGLFDSTE